MAKRKNRSQSSGLGQLMTPPKSADLRASTDILDAPIAKKRLKTIIGNAVTAIAMKSPGKAEEPALDDANQAPLRQPTPPATPPSKRLQKLKIKLQAIFGSAELPVLPTGYYEWTPMTDAELFDRNGICVDSAAVAHLPWSQREAYYEKAFARLPGRSSRPVWRDVRWDRPPRRRSERLWDPEPLSPGAKGGWSLD